MFWMTEHLNWWWQNIFGNHFSLPNCSYFMLWMIIQKNSQYFTSIISITISYLMQYFFNSVEYEWISQNYENSLWHIMTVNGSILQILQKPLKCSYYLCAIFQVFYSYDRYVYEEITEPTGFTSLFIENIALIVHLRNDTYRSVYLQPEVQRARYHIRRRRGRRNCAECWRWWWLGALCSCPSLFCLLYF